MVILMISQQMQPKKHSEHNQVKCTNYKLLFFYIFLHVPATHWQAIGILAWFKMCLIDVEGKAPPM